MNSVTRTAKSACRYARKGDCQVVVSKRRWMPPADKSCSAVTPSSKCSAEAEWGLCGWRATKEQYDRMITEGLSALDKSGIAELTFKDRHKRSGVRV